jgi:hypothetical protein
VNGGVVVTLVDSENDCCDVVTRCGSRNDYLFGARNDVLCCVDRLGEVTGRLNDNVYAQFAPRKLGGITLCEDLDRGSIDNNLVVVEGYFCVETTGDRVVLEKMSESFVVCEVIDSNNFNIAVLGQSRSKEIAANATETINTDFYAHCCSRKSGV